MPGEQTTRIQRDILANLWSEGDYFLRA